MPRIRTFKPEFWTDEKTGTLPEFSKCLFLGLLNHSDDYGVIEWAPREWRTKIFPYHPDHTSEPILKALFDDLLPRGLVIWFSRKPDVGQAKQYLFIRNFAKHQLVNRPSHPLIPGWKKGDTLETYADRVGDTLQVLTPDAVHTPLSEGSWTHH